jgi:hypothetical protein
VLKGYNALKVELREKEEYVKDDSLREWKNGGTSVEFLDRMDFLEAERT